MFRVHSPACRLSAQLFRLLLVLWLIPNLVQAQVGTTPQSSEHNRRLAALCKLWGHITYFHPYLPAQYRAWDSAFAATVPLVKPGQSRTEYQRVVEQLVAVLNDPVTRVITSSSPPLPRPRADQQPTQTLTNDSILVVRLGQYADLRDLQNWQIKAQAIRQQLKQVKAVLFDLRTESHRPDDPAYVQAFFAEFNGLFSPAPITSLPQRGRLYDGFPTETGYSTGGFTTASYQVIPDVFEPEPGLQQDVPSVFLVNQAAILPPVALALQQAGKAAVVSVGELADAHLVQTSLFELPDSVQVQMRLTQLSPSESTPFVKAAYPLAPTTADTVALQIALQVLRTRAFGPPPPPVISQPDVVSMPPQYPAASYPLLGYRVLAAAKIWTVIHYFFAYKELMNENWDQLLLDYLPRLEASRDSLSYTLTLAEWYTHIHDGHGFINSPVLDAYLGVAPSPVVVRLVQKKPIITAFRDDSVARALGIEVGDEILSIGGESAAMRLARYHRYQSASTPDAGDRYATQLFLSGPTHSSITVQLKGRAPHIKTVQLPRDLAFYRSGIYNERGHLPILRRLPGNIGYADLDRLTTGQLDSLFVLFQGTKALILDMRGYPNGVYNALSARLTHRPHVAGASFWHYAPRTPVWDQASQNASITKSYFKNQLSPPVKQPYRGRVVMLIDERAQSQAEYTGLFVAAATPTVFVGSVTAGANGDVTYYRVPGGMTLAFSGNNVSHADGRQLQRVGIKPTIAVKPTISGVRAGRDEVLERALHYLQQPSQQATVGIVKGRSSQP